MWTRTIPWLIGLLLATAIRTGRSQEDSLRSALKAVNRLQRDLSDKRGYEDYYSSDDYPAVGAVERRALEREVFDQLQDNNDFNNELYKWGMRKRFSSSFRERIQENNQKNKKYLTEKILNKLREREHSSDEDEDYPELLKELWDTYNSRNVYRNYPRVLTTEHYDKRLFPAEYYTNLGYNEVGMKKRNRNNNLMFIPNYDLRDDYDQFSENLENPSQYYEAERSKGSDNFDLSNYSMKKRFRVTKRSSSTKKSPIKELPKTDPKVEEDLSNIFEKAKKNSSHSVNPKKTTKTESAPINPKQENGKSERKETKEKTETHKEKKENKDLNKETTSLIPKERPLHMEKKSINWSDYFGIDKRKLDDIDNEWLMERYHKAVAMASKRDSEVIPAKNYQKENDPEFLQSENKQEDSSDINIDKMETDLKDVEESIIDETLKYTGAHEGITDSKEVQELKDKVISQLAAAYNLEKMRQALGDYKNSIAKQKDKLKQEGREEYHFEEKRSSIPRKQAIDENEEVDKTPNHVKCPDDDYQCEEEEEEFYRTPTYHFEKLTWNQDSCTKIQLLCKEQAVDYLGMYNNLLTTACTRHQTCLVCNENNWFSPTRECNQLFMGKANSLCVGDYICQKIARNSIPHLVNLNKALVIEPNDECAQYCPGQDNKPRKSNKTT